MRPVFFLVFCLLVSISGCDTINGDPDLHARNSGVRTVADPQRIIATTPSTTEILFQLGLGDRIVGICQFSKFPEKETAKIAKIGGLLDRDDEAIIRLNPDIVIELEENRDSFKRLSSFGIEVFCVDHKSIASLIDSFEIIGRRFGPEYEKKGKQIRDQLVSDLAKIENESQKRNPKRVLISVDRERNTGKLLSVYASGKDDMYAEALRITGGINVAANSLISFPIVSPEEIIRWNPEVIIDLYTAPPIKADLGRDDWKSLGDGVDAVRNDKIYVFTQDYTTIPGPRFVKFIKELAEVLK
ncbi:MAG: ABC transporter substrate-binding protein [Thermoguttaceae bacterium]